MLIRHSILITSAIFRNKRKSQSFQLNLISLFLPPRGVPKIFNSHGVDGREGTSGGYQLIDQLGLKNQSFSMGRVRYVHKSGPI